MAIRLLIDESIRHGSLRNSIVRHNRASRYRIDSLVTGDEGAPSLGSEDPELLRWCESNDRVLVCNDRETMAMHFRDHLLSGAHSAGVMVLRPAVTIPEIVQYLSLACFASDPVDWFDRYEYIP